MRPRLTPLSVALLLLALPIAGCLDAPAPAAEPAGASDAPPAGDAREGPRAWPDALPELAGAIGGSQAYFEPSIDFTPDGRPFVTAIRGMPSRSPIWEYNAAEDRWIPRGANVARAGEIGGGDADIEFDSQGRGYHLDLWLGNDGLAFSKDGVSWTGVPASHYVPVNDRQWLAHYQDKYLYLVTNQIPGGIVAYRADISTPLGEAGSVMFAQETPVSALYHPGRIAPAGFPAVDQTDGTLYIPVDHFGGLDIFRSFTHGLTFARASIPGVGGGVTGFPTVAVDAAGTVYAAWTEDKAGKFDVYYSYSTSKGARWANPVRVNSFDGAHVMPWLVAGEAGRIAIAWYGTDKAGKPDSDNDFKDADWSVYLAESRNAGQPGATFQEVELAGPVHRGSINLYGINQPGDRSLGDYLSAAINPVDGRVWVAFTRNDPGTPEQDHGVWVVAAP